MLSLLAFAAGVFVTVGVGTATVLMLGRFKLLRDAAHDALLDDRVRVLETTVTQLVMVAQQDGGKPGVPISGLTAAADNPADAELHDVSTEGLSR